MNEGLFEMIVSPLLVRDTRCALGLARRRAVAHSTEVCEDMCGRVVDLDVEDNVTSCKGLRIKQRI